MKKLQKQFDELSSRVQLTGTEKDAMRAYLSEYAALKPMPGRVGADTLRYGAVKSPMPFFAFKPLPVFAAIALFLAGSVGVSAAAQGAVPGDFLYPVKVSVNEKIGGAFALSDEAKASYATALANERLSEAETLAAEGKLSSGTAATLAQSFSAEAATAKAHIALLKDDASDAAAVSQTKFDAVLTAHADILASVSGDSSERADLISSVRAEGEHPAASPVAVVATTFSAKAAAPRMTAPAAIEATSAPFAGHADAAAAAAMRSAALDSYAKAAAMVKRLSGKLSAENRTAAEASLSAAEALTTEGDAQLAAGEADSAAIAFTDYEKALSATEELMLRVKSNASIRFPAQITPKVLIDFAASGRATKANANLSGAAKASAAIKATVGDILDIVQGTSTASSPNTGEEGSDSRSSGASSGSVSGGIEVSVPAGSVDIHEEGSVLH